MSVMYIMYIYKKKCLCKKLELISVEKDNIIFNKCDLPHCCLHLVGSHIFIRNYSLSMFVY